MMWDISGPIVTSEFMTICVMVPTSHIAHDNDGGLVQLWNDKISSKWEWRKVKNVYDTEVELGLRK